MLQANEGLLRANWALQAELRREKDQTRRLKEHDDQADAGQDESMELRSELGRERARAQREHDRLESALQVSRARGPAAACSSS